MATKGIATQLTGLRALLACFGGPTRASTASTYGGLAGLVTGVKTYPHAPSASSRKASMASASERAFLSQSFLFLVSSTAHAGATARNMLPKETGVQTSKLLEQKARQKLRLLVERILFFGRIRLRGNSENTKTA